MYWLLRPTFGKRSFLRFYRFLFNISLVGMNFRNTTFERNGEKYILSLVEKLGHKGDSLVLFDVGANSGKYSAMLDSLIKPPKRIFAFEPFSAPFAQLKKIADHSPAITAFRIGFGATAEKRVFYSSSAFDEIGSLYEKDFSKFGFSQDLKEEVSISTIDEFCSENKIDSIQFLKVDVEGHDFFVLKGAGKMISAGKIGMIQFEFGTANYLSKTYLYDFYSLLSTNYRLFRLLSNGLDEIVEYNTDYEIHVLNNYIAIRKDLHSELFQS